MGLQVWRSERADGLLPPLAALLSRPPTDPFAPEVIAVPTAGIERWLAQELSLRLGTTVAGGTDGVCANVDFPFPGRVIATALEAAGGAAGGGDGAGDVWQPDRLVWPLLQLAAAFPDAPWWGPAAPHLASVDDGRRYSAARTLADLFDRYAVHRPGMLLAWHEQEDVGPDGKPIPDAHAWQPELWRRLRAHVATPSTAERFDAATAALAAGGVPLALPERLSVFGLTALPESYLRVLTALATDRDVHLFLLHPSPALWDRVARHLAGRGAAAPTRGPREQDGTADLPRNPLLASWGRDAREMQVVFAAVGADDATARPVDGAAPATLLERLQHDVRADRAPVGAPVDGTIDLRPVLEPGDRSVQVHACHGRMRQVQVLRDAILHLLADDPTLEPRDIIVMCPDVEAFAPLVDAVFGAYVEPAADGGDRTGTAATSPPLRVRLADRSLRQTNPVLKVVAELLELADGRITGPEVLDLLGREPVRRRFRFADDDLERIEGWVADVGVRWGLDGDDRARFDLADLAANTWRFGLDRLLTGVAIADEDLRMVADAVPYDDVEGADVELAGRVAECVARLADVCADLRAARPIAAWRDAVARAADLLTATPDDEAWRRQQLDRILDELVDHAGDGGAGTAGGSSDGGATAATDLGLAELRVLLADRLRGRPTRANHRTGDLTVCTLVPMRAVPHRVVCLLGMDDGTFPRRTVGDGDDLVDLVPFVGDRDPRTEDRQLLLDALLAATDHLVVTYAGRDERTNEPLPPAVPIGELLDVVDATVRVPAADPTDAGLAVDPSAPRARDVVVTAHPLQPFDPRNYLAGELGTAGPWSFDTVGLAGAAARRAELADPAPFLSAPLPPRPEDADVVDLGALVRFLQHPARAFLSERLGVWLPSDTDTLDDGIPVELDGLQRWRVGSRLLAARLAGHPTEAWERVERARGTLPPAPRCAEVLDEIRPVVDDLLAAAADLVGDEPERAVDVDVALGDGRRLLGTVTGVHGDRIAAVSYSSIHARTRLAAYARLVALTLAEPGTPWTAVLVSRLGGRGRHHVEWCTLGPLGDDAAGRRSAAGTAMATLVDLHDRGMRLPAPLYGDTSEAIARKVAAGRSAWDASGTWETTWPPYPKGDLDPCHVAVLGRVATFTELLQEPPRPDEVGDAWPACEERIVAWARRLWDPVLAIEDGGTR